MALISRHRADSRSLRSVPFVFVFAFLFALAMDTRALGQIDIQGAAQMPEAEVEGKLSASHPAVYYAYAKPLFTQGRKDDAVFWFYVGQLRYRLYLLANPQLPRDGDPAVMASLNATVGQSINDWAGGDPKSWAAAMERALRWDANNDNGFTSKSTQEKQWRETRAGLAALRDQIIRDEAKIRAERERRGLSNR
ncbi:MAG TPA: hypothetical protein VGA27_15885 [Candidatus Binatia bacterium]